MAALGGNADRPLGARVAPVVVTSEAWEELPQLELTAPIDGLVLADTMPSTAHIGPPDVPLGGPLAPRLFSLCKA